MKTDDREPGRSRATEVKGSYTFQYQFLNSEEAPGMDPHPNMNEGEFIKAIDEHFYFETDREYEEIARMGCSISDNAALMVGYQLAIGSSHASPEGNLGILEILKQERPAPVVLAAIPVIKSLLNGEPVAQEDTLRLLDACRGHSNAWCGLGVVLCSDVSLEQECESIMAGWRSAENGGKDG
jgi:hypothetical protein